MWAWVFEVERRLRDVVLLVRAWRMDGWMVEVGLFS